MAKKKSQRALSKWTKQKWTTKSGKPSLQTGERYLPAKAIKAISPQMYGASTRAKRKAMKEGKQFSKLSKNALKKVRRYR